MPKLYCIHYIVLHRIFTAPKIGLYPGNITRRFWGKNCISIIGKRRGGRPPFEIKSEHVRTTRHTVGGHRRRSIIF